MFGRGWFEGRWWFEKLEKKIRGNKIGLFQDPPPGRVKIPKSKNEVLKKLNRVVEKYERAIERVDRTLYLIGIFPS